MPGYTRDGGQSLKQMLAHAAHLRRCYDEDPKFYLDHAKRGKFPSYVREWQLPWELRVFKIVDGALSQSFGDEVIEEAADATWIAMCGIVEAIEEDLCRGIPWWKRLFIRRSTLSAELTNRARYLAGW